MRHQKVIGLTFALLAVWGLALNKTSHADSNSVTATQNADKTNSNRFKGGELHHQIRTYLSSMKDIQGERKESLPQALTQIIIVNQPKSGDFLLSLIAQRNNKLRRRAINAFIQTWNTMNLQQIDGFIRRAIELKIDCDKRYPEALRSLIEVEYSSVDGWGGWPSKHHISLKTKSSFSVDGKIMGNPFSNSGPMATIGWINTNDLNLGNHTAQMFFEYEFTYQGVQYRGHFKSKKFHFRIVEDNQDNILKAKDSPELEAKVRASFHIAETEKELIPQLPPGPSTARNLSDGPNGTKPQISSYERTTGLRTTAHCPYWRIAPGLPVDMIFYVIIQDLTTGKNFRGNDIGVPKGAKGLGIFAPFKLEEFADGRTGTIPIKITLKPSQSRAQSTGWVTQYYPRKLTIKGLTIQVVSTHYKTD